MNKKKWLFLILGITIVTLGVIIGISSCKHDNTEAIREFTIQDTLEDGEHEKVKVILLAGQSNASGCSHISELQKNVTKEKMNEYEQGYSNIYINYFNDNGTNKSQGFVNVKTGQGANSSLFGPELAMAEKFNELYPDEKIFIIKYAWGGTNLYRQWRVDDGALYKAFINFVNTSMDYLTSKNYDADIVATMWMQGESDANQTFWLSYGKNTNNFIKSLRIKFDKYIKTNMYFIDAYISDSIYWTFYKQINNAKHNVCETSLYNICIDTINEELTYKKEPINAPDLAHYDSLSEIKLGHLFVQAYYDATKK